MSKNFWLKRWEAGQIGFHQKNINPQLEKSWQSIKTNERPVFVPLCGKTLDMTFLAANGHKVIGVEFSEQAIKDFFNSLELEPHIRTDGTFKIFEAGSYQIYCGDLFQLELDFSNIAYIYDRASYIALDASQREKYRNWISKHLPHVSILLLTIEFDHLTAGPPFSISKTELEQGFSSAFHLQCLFDEFIDKEKSPHSDITTYLIERVHKLTPKS